MSDVFFFKINLENEQELYFMIVKKSEFGQMSQIWDNGPLRVKALTYVWYKAKWNLAPPTN